MAVTVKQKPGMSAAEGDSAGKTIYYVIRGTRSEETAKSSLRSTAPTTTGAGTRTLLLATLSVREVSVADDLPLNRCVWEGVAQYKRRLLQPDTGDTSFNFHTSGATEHINQSIATKAMYTASGEEDPDNNRAIGVTKDGVDGCDIVVVKYDWTETIHIDANLVTWDYRSTIFGTVGHVNDRRWRIFDRGEVLCLGVDGGYRSGEDFELQFQFSAQQNRTDLSIGSISGIRKEGWNHLWLRFAKDEAGGRVTQTPKAVYVEQVYYYANFALLGLGD